MKLSKVNIKNKYSRGMTYVELIVVLSIFSVMTSIMMFNYRSFQANVDIKNLASDLALKIVQAQRYSLSGKIPSAQLAVIPSGWKPSYGVYIDMNNPTRFLFFTDLDPSLTSDNSCDDGTCTTFGQGEFIEGVNINNNKRISSVDAYNNSGSICANPTITNIVFRRPNSGALFNVSPTGSCGDNKNIDHLVIHITSGGSDPSVSNVTVYKSGRIQVK